MSEDEDIVLKSSPLDRYLKDITDIPYSNYESILNQSKLLDKDCLSETRSLKSISIGPPFSIGPPILVNSCLQLMNSGLLLDNDEKLLLEFKEILDNIEFSAPKKQLFENNFVVAYLVCVLSIIVPFFLQKTFLYVYFILVLGILAFFSHRIFNNRKVKRFTSLVLEFCNVLYEYNCLLDKCIVHVKEAELINHAMPNLNSFGLALDLKKFSGHTCSLLRKLLVSSICSSFHKCRNLEKIILKGNLTNRFDVKDEYIASISLDFFSDILNLNGNAAELKDIKQLVGLYRLQLSELVYKMVNQIYFLEFDKSCQIIDLSKDITVLVKEFSQEIQHSLNLSIRNIFEKKETIPLRTNKKVDNTNQLLHSSEIYLLSALNCIEKVRDIFQTLNDSQTDDKLELISCVFMQFNVALENSKSLIESIENSFKSKKVTMQTVSEKWLRDQDNNLSTNSNVVMFQELEKQGDLLYEGQSEKLPFEMVDFENSEDFEKSKRFESRNLMRELKCILAVKEKPEGLISFPLSKPTEINEYKEDSDKVSDFNFKRKKMYLFDQNDYVKPEFQIPLPIRNLCSEEIFGNNMDSAEDNQDDKRD